MGNSLEMEKYMLNQSNHGGGWTKREKKLQSQDLYSREIVFKTEGEMKFSSRKQNKTKLGELTASRFVLHGILKEALQTAG